MSKPTTGPIDHDQLYVEVCFIQGVLAGMGVRTVSVCCAFGVDVDDPLFAKDVRVGVESLADYLRGHETSGVFHLGWTNITLAAGFGSPAFSIGNDNDIFCEGEDSGLLSRVRQRWTARYPFAG